MKLRTTIFSLIALFFIFSFVKAHSSSLTLTPNKTSEISSKLGSEVIIVIGENSSQTDMISAQIIQSSVENENRTIKIIKDTEYVQSNTDVIIIGGSCINSLSATFLNITYPTCGMEFLKYLENDNVIIKNQNNIYLVAGYDATDTMHATQHFIE